MIKNIKIYDTEYTKKRFGLKKDGGYVILDEIFKKCDILYSYGISDDVSFELDFVKQNPEAQVRLFDHTIDSLPEKNKNFSFLKQGIATEKKNDLDTLENHLNLYGDINKPNKTLKIDIEWNEWDVFDKMPENTLTQFDQIICEFHFIPVIYKDTHTEYFTKFHKFVYKEINKILFAKYQNVLDKITKHYYIYHLHINNSLKLNKIDEQDFPPLVEMSFVNKKIINKPCIIKPEYPIKDLDYPNKYYREDILNFDWNKHNE